MRYRLIKSGLLIALAILTLYQILPFGDYCSGLVQIILMLVFGGFLILTFLVFTVIDIVRLIRKKVNFDFIPLIIMLLVGLTFYIFINADSDKFWTKTKLTGQIDVGDLRGAQMQLYDNNTFAVRISYVDWTCTYQGNFKIIGDTLILEKVELPELTDHVFNTKYKLSQQDSLLIPFDKKYNTIKIKTGHNSAYK